MASRRRPNKRPREWRAHAHPCELSLTRCRTTGVDWVTGEATQPSRAFEVKGEHDQSLQEGMLELLEAAMDIAEVFDSRGEGGADPKVLQARPKMDPRQVSCRDGACAPLPSRCRVPTA